jgi:hypothetical protein
MILSFDTSNYTTSVAAFDGTEVHNVSRLLDVAPGTLGLRQSDALFSHVKRLPELTDRLFSVIGAVKLDAVGVSTRPRAVECSKEMQRRMAFRKSLVELFNRKNSKGQLLFTKKVQWVAIFRVAIKRGFAFEQDYASFEDYLKFIELTDLPVPFDKNVVRKNDFGVYHMPISEWTSERYIEKNMAKVAKPFFEMNNIANTFLEILDRNMN